MDAVVLAGAFRSRMSRCMLIPRKPKAMLDIHGNRWCSGTGCPWSANRVENMVVID
jgi:hypothetical protein